MRHLHLGKLLLVVFSLLLACTVSARKPIKTLLITGQNNHNWQVSHVVLKQILENSGRFDVDYNVDFANGGSLNVGNQTRFTSDRIRQVSIGMPTFRHEKWEEYLYADYSLSLIHI